jgi:hypothetical protein
LIYFVVPRQQQNRIPSLLRQLLRLSEFKTKAARMGKVARLSEGKVEFWQVGDEKRRLRRFE